MNMYMCMCIYIPARVNVHGYYPLDGTHTQILSYTYSHTQTHSHILTYTHIHTHMLTYTHILTYSKSMFTSVYMHGFVR